MISIAPLSSIIAQCEQSAAELKSYRHKMTIYGQSAKGIAIVEGAR